MNCEGETGIQVSVLSIRRIAIGFVHIYQRVVSPWLRPACRFEPSCSHYAVAAIENHGLARGGWMSLRRLVRCNPFGGSGFDPVP